MRFIVCLIRTALVPAARSDRMGSLAQQLQGSVGWFPLPNSCATSDGAS